MKKAEIKITVELDEGNNPDNILWESTDSGNADKVPAKAMFLSVWDHNYKNTLKIDLWTKDMPVDEMKRFFYETLQTMGDSFLKATNETLIVEDLRDYCAHFADKMGIIEGQ
ncbi:MULTISPECIES: gliding motility protein GldC [Pedobacter]|jgi:gliding motility-associated protein GldC|uniref:Gliding motility protein GldC n=2 Tax=Pedobacter TaxID=84567 RepID=A0A4R0Q0Q2_9SPHI|nr:MULTISPECIES: gliding motility protein GldC [Pedobacter]MBB6239415.1 gliding motility-associated protein GldC [Pedobacter sp. AK013]NII81643.1 gliding motility-associated protein GldC [Pedobacter sp. SG908]NMN35647.1 gliding motility-associated protein GldC [Pedobacter sp. SG918]QDW23834.1 gliding motility protein GldC [Pedobacter sp. KBS0701]QNR85578.1 gliding motility protein GldC [Pedobacter riviphilus]